MSVRLFLSVSILVAFFSCSPKHKIYKAEYSFKYQNMENENSLAGLILNNITYSITTDGKTLKLNTNFSDSENGDLKVVNSGPNEAIYNISSNYVEFDKLIDTLYEFTPIKLKEINTRILIDNYSCKLAITANGDSIYYSEKLPYFINPFFLNKSSLNFGIVKAVLSKSGTYHLRNYNITANDNQQKLFVPSKNNKIRQTNVFFE